MLDPTSSTWTTTGTLHTTADGTASTAFSGSGQYDTGVQISRGTYGPPTLTFTGWTTSERSGTITESGQASSTYSYSADAVLESDGSWQAIAGTATFDASASDDLGHSGTGTYGYPVAGGAVTGTSMEAQDDVTAYHLHTDATANPTGTWTTTGTLQLTADGTASANYVGDGSYDVVGTTFGPYGAAATSLAWFATAERTGTITEQGNASSSYHYVSDAALQADGSWLTVFGVGTSDASGRIRTATRGHSRTITRSKGARSAARARRTNRTAVTSISTATRAGTRPVQVGSPRAP